MRFPQKTIELIEVLVKNGNVPHTAKELTEKSGIKKNTVNTIIGRLLKKMPTEITKEGKYYVLSETGRQKNITDLIAIATERKNKIKTIATSKPSVKVRKSLQQIVKEKIEKESEKSNSSNGLLVSVQIKFLNSLEILFGRK